MRKVFCDRCFKEIENPTQKTSTLEIYHSGGGSFSAEFHTDCALELITEINQSYQPHP